MWLFLAFLAVPLIEIALFIKIGGLLGLWPTLAIVVMTAFAGTWLVRTQGAIAMGDLRNSFVSGADPSESLAHGAMIILAGALLLTPGFFTDAVGFALLFPPFRRMAFTWVRQRVTVQTFEMGGSNRQSGNQYTDIDGEFHEVDDTEALKLPPDKPSGWTKH